ncbi:MAG: 30S ribosomal protein S6 [Alphaproteobacteria bacterium]|nr:30S ribosomal protein S6 [Alphaproteobacteria bacterium]
MPYYECVFIARQDVPTAQIEGLTSYFADVLTENGGRIAKSEYWGLKALAYKIKKNRKGHYIMLNIDAPWAAVAEMERLMRLHDDVIRHLTIRAEELEEGPSIMMLAKSTRDGPRRERGDRGDRERGDRGDRGDRDRGERGERGDRDRGDRERGERQRDRAPAAPRTDESVSEDEGVTA